MIVDQSSAPVVFNGIVNPIFWHWMDLNLVLKVLIVWLHCILLQVIEKAELLRDMDSNLLPVLLRLQELVRTSLCVWI